MLDWIRDHPILSFFSFLVLYVIGGSIYAIRFAGRELAVTWKNGERDDDDLSTEALIQGFIDWIALPVIGPVRSLGRLTQGLIVKRAENIWRKAGSVPPKPNRADDEDVTTTLERVPEQPIVAFDADTQTLPRVEE